MDAPSWRNLAAIWRRIAAVTAPPPERDPVQWGRDNIRFPKTSPFPGPFDPQKTPHLIAIAEAYCQPVTRQVDFVTSAQNGKTAFALMCVGQKTDDDPQPILYVGPTEKNLREKIEPRLMEMINGAPGLRGKLLRGKASTKTHKKIAGTTISLAHSGSETEVSSVSAALVIVDEIDRMRDIPGKGSQIEMSAARQDLYIDSKRVTDSTPTLGLVETEIDETSGLERWKVADPDNLHSAAWQQWQEGSREEFAVPCPHCGEWFIPRMKLLWFPDDCSPEEAQREARLTCPANGCMIRDEHRAWMHGRGVFVGPGQSIDTKGRVGGDLINIEHRSFWVSGLMVPAQTFGDRAKRLVAAKQSQKPGREQAVVNLAFGECYAASGDAPDWQQVAACRDDYQTGTVPERVQRVLVSVDVQKDRLITCARGWGYALESWGLEYAELWGDTKDKDDPCWAQLRDLLLSSYGGLAVWAMAIDSGYNTAAVDAFARCYQDRVYATVGARSDNPPYLWRPTPQDEDMRGKRLRRGYLRWTVNHGYFKAMVHARLAWPQEQKGAWHIPEDYGDDYCRGIVAERRMRLPSGGSRWEVVYRENHPLDCEYLQFWLAHVTRCQDLPDPDEVPGEKSMSLEELAESLNP